MSLLYFRSTRVTVVDAFTDLHVPITEGLNLHLAAEGAGITGKTNRSTTYNARDRVHVLSAGPSVSRCWVCVTTPSRSDSAAGSRQVMATQMTTPWRTLALTVTSTSAWSSSTRSWAASMPPITTSSPTSYAGRPPDGVEATVNEGSFRRATYVQPRVEVTPVSWARARLGALFAWSTAPVSHGFYTLRNGGVPVNHLKQPTFAMRSAQSLDWSLQIGPFLDDDHLSDTRVPFQGGHAFLDSNLGGERVDRYIMMLHVL